MTTLKDYLTYAVQEGASDIFIVPGAPVSIKTDGQIKHIDEEKVMPSLAEGLITELYALSERDMQGFQQTGDDDFSFAIPGISRFQEPLRDSFFIVLTSEHVFDGYFPAPII